MPGVSGIPELAGVATYARAAHIGYTVDESVRRLLRFNWTERRIAEILVSRLTATPEWEVKCALALHQWQAALRADALRQRVTEMRNPAPSLDYSPDPQLSAFLEEVLHADDTVELLAGVYGVVLPALWAAYRAHIEATNPLVDHPTRRIMRAGVPELEEAIAWGELALAALIPEESPARVRAEEWKAHLVAYLLAARGIPGSDEPAPETGGLPPRRARHEFIPDMHPRRDERFVGQYNFNFPPHVVYNAPGIPPEERNLALLCKRTLEMDVPEMMASFLTERKDQPWEFYLEYSRQLWDEARHAMMGTVALEARGVDWKSIPLNIGFALRLNLHATPLERQIMLFAIEQSLMPADVGKRSEFETAVAARDELSAHFHDYDWADEVLHARIGRRALKREGVTPEQAAERAKLIHEKTWAVLQSMQKPEDQIEWWPDFVQTVLGHESATKHVQLPELNILSE